MDKKNTIGEGNLSKSDKSKLKKALSQNNLQKTRKMLYQLLRKNINPVSKDKKKETYRKVQEYLNGKGLGIHILSKIGENAETELEINMVRSDSIHTKETFRQLFKAVPTIKKEITEVLAEDSLTKEEFDLVEKKDKEALSKMIR